MITLYMRTDGGVEVGGGGLEISAWRSIKTSCRPGNVAKLSSVFHSVGGQTSVGKMFRLVAICLLVTIAVASPAARQKRKSLIHALTYSWHCYLVSLFYFTKNKTKGANIMFFFSFLNSDFKCMQVIGVLFTVYQLSFRKK